MKKFYSEPELEIRKYSLTGSTITTSIPEQNGKNDFNKDDTYDNLIGDGE